MYTLYSYPRSTASYRVRIALRLKNIPFETININLLQNEQHSSSFHQKNPNNTVPVLEIKNEEKDINANTFISQSMAIMEYLEEKNPKESLLPSDILERAKVRAFCGIIVSDIHPIQNLRVLQSVEYRGINRQEWALMVIEMGFDAIEDILVSRIAQCGITPYCFGERITMADICLVPQWHNFLRYKGKAEKFPNIHRIVDKCKEHSAFSQDEIYS